MSGDLKTLAAFAEGDRAARRARPSGADSLKGATIDDRLEFEWRELCALGRAPAGHGSLDLGAHVEPNGTGALEPSSRPPAQDPPWHFYLEMDAPELDLARLSECLSVLTSRHEPLRTLVRRGAPRQGFPEVPCGLVDVRDLRSLGAAEVDASLDKIRAELGRETSTVEPCARFEAVATLLPASTRFHVAIVSSQFDWWSVCLLLRDAASLYARRGPIPLETRTDDWAPMGEAWRETKTFRLALSHWQRRLSTLPPPPRLPRSAWQDEGRPPRIVWREHWLDAAASDGFTQRARGFGLAPSVALLAAYAAVLGTWSINQHFTLGLPRSDRSPFHGELAGASGNFSSITPLDVDYRTARSLVELAKSLQDELLEHRAHHHLPGSEARRQAARAASQGTWPITFTAVPKLAAGHESALLDALGRVVNLRGRPPEAELDCQIHEREGCLQLVWAVAEPKLAPGVAEAMFDAFCRLVKQLAECADVWQAPRLELVPPDQLAVRSRVNATQGPPITTDLDSLFVARAAAQPDSTAVITDTRTLTYRELDSRAEAVARALLERGAMPSEPVAVLLPKSWQQIVAVLGAIRAGCAYLPVHPNLPEQRLRYILENARVRHVLGAEERSLGVERGSLCGLLCVDRLEPAQERAAPHATNARRNPESLAYVIHTSGSTGVPKGVMVRDGGVVNAVQYANERCNFGPSDRVLALAALHHDLSVYDIFGALLGGGSLVVPAEQHTKDPEHWLELLARHAITVWNSVPAMMEMLVTQAEADRKLLPDSLRHIILGGDWIPVKLPLRIRRLAPAATVHSIGGPTETTIWNVWHTVREGDTELSSIPYGKPITHSQYHVLDGASRNRPDGVVGEMYCSGLGLAVGYLGDDIATAERFVTHPSDGSRLYRTGDLGRYREDGVLEFIGRTDFQVKLRGHRIELGEIETTLLNQPGVRAACAVVVDSGLNARLVAFVVPSAATDGVPLIQRLRIALRGRLPEHMVPSELHLLERLPQTPNGKVDRKDLAEKATRATVSPTTVSIAADGDQLSAEAPSTDGSAPRHAALSLLCRAMASVLDVATIDPDDDFFEAGGDSIRAIKLIWKVRQAGFKLQPIQIVNNPTPAMLARCLGGGPDAATKPMSLEAASPLTAIAKQFFRWQLVHQNHYNQGQVFELTSRLDLGALRAMFSVLESQHEALRTRYERSASGWQQRCVPRSEQPPVELLDARGVAEAELRGWLAAAGDEAHGSLDIESGPLYAARLVRLDTRDLLLVAMHHLAVDRVSWMILADDLDRLIEQHRAGDNLALERGTSSFREWARGVQAYAQGAALQDEIGNYWCALAQEEACDAPPELLSKLEPPARGVWTHALDERETSRLLTVSPAAFHARVDDLLLTALGGALERTFGSRRWRILLEGHGRQEELVPGADLSRTVGWFTTIFPFVLDVANDSLDTTLRSVKERLAAIPHKGIGYGLARYSRLELPAQLREALEKLDATIAFNYLGQVGKDLSYRHLRACDLPSGTAVSAANRSALLLEITAWVNGGGQLQFEFLCAADVEAHVRRLASAITLELGRLNTLCEKVLEERGQGRAGPEKRTRLLARPARPEERAQVRDVCAATFALSDAPVAKRLGTIAFFDPLWESDASAKFVLQAGDRIVGYLVGARDLDGYDSRGVCRALQAAAALIVRRLWGRCCGDASWHEVVELIGHSRFYWGSAMCRLKAWLDRASAFRAPAYFHLNVLPEYRGAGGLLGLLELWEEWLRARGERHAYLRVGDFVGMEGDRSRQADLALGLGYAPCTETNARDWWVKDLETASDG